MKHVYYKHKKSETYISLEDLKEMKVRGNHVGFSVQKPIIFNDPYPIDIKEISPPEYFEYDIREIPFSEDFEIFCIDEQDLNLFDLDRIISAVNKDLIFPIGTLNKLKENFRKLLKIRHEYHTPDIIRKIIE